MARVYVRTWRDTYAGMLPARALVAMSPENWTVQWSRTIAGKRPGSSVLVAESGARGRKRIVGLGSCGPARDESMKMAGEVYTLYVDTGCQEQGAGRQLLLESFRQLNGFGFESAVVWVLAPNPSRYFYEAMGGNRMAEREGRMWGARVEESQYAWPDLDAAVRYLEAQAKDIEV